MKQIQCALSQSQVEKLYSNVYGHMLKEGEAFDPQQYMKDLFNKIANKSDIATAAKFMQQVPSLIGTASFRPALESFDIKTDSLRPLIRSFKNDEKGFENTIIHFTPMFNPEVRKELVQQIERDSFEVEEKSGEDVIKDILDYNPYSAMSTTFQEFVSMDPEFATQEEKIETSKRVIYNTLAKIKVEMDKTPSLKSLVYQGTEIKLKPVRLTEIDPSKLDKATARLLDRAQFLEARGKAQANVTKPENIFLMVMSDKDGVELYFSNEGDITTEAQGGGLVYQFFRDVRKKGDKYTVTDIYNNQNQILSADMMVFNLERKGHLVGFSQEQKQSLIDQIEKKQQEEFKALYDFKNKLEAGETQLLPVTGISKGVAEFTPKSLSLSNLADVVEDVEDAMSTIDTVKSPRSGFGKGDAVIQIQGKEYKIDRPNLTDDIARKIAAVLTNKNISKKERYKFVMQFLSQNASNSTRKHKLYYLPNTDELIFSYSKNTYKEGYDSKFTTVNLDSSTASDEIYKALMFASGTAGKYYSAKMTYNKDKLKINGYQDYDLTTNTLDSDFSTYSTLLSTLPNTKIDVDLSSKSRSFNSYIGFSLPNEFTEQAEQAEQEEKKIITDDFFDTLTEELSESEALYNTLKDEALTDEWKAVVDARTKTKNKDVYYISSYIENQITTKPERFSRDTAQEVIALFKTFGNASDKQVTVLNKAVDKAFAPKQNVAKPAAQKTIEEIDAEINNAINPDGVAAPEDDDLGDVFFRSKNLPADVTPEQIKEAQEWWDNSPLKKYINLKHVANIVNSNAYAAFIKHASVLNGNLGTIKIANKGSMVDVYHEAWHGFSQLFLTKAEKESLYKEVRKKLGGRKSFFEIEERLAEDFRTYAMNPKVKKDSPKRNSLFRKILNFLRELFGLGSTTDVMEIQSVREMFDKLYLGTELNNYTPLTNNVMFDVLERNSGIVALGTQTDQVLNRQDSNALKNSMDSIISDIVNKANEASKSSSRTLSVLLDSRNRDTLYKRIRIQLQSKLDNYRTQLEATPDTEDNQIKREILDNRIRILSAGIDNYGDTKEGLVKYHLENSAYDLIKQKYTVLELDEEGNLFDPSSLTDSERYGDKKVGDKSLVELAGKETLYILKSLHAVDKNNNVQYDELGFKKLADFRTLWNNTVRAISGLQDPQEMYNKLLEESQNIPEFKQLVSLTPGEGKLADPSQSNDLYEFRTTTSFWQDFNKSRVPYIQLTVFGNPVYRETMDINGNLVQTPVTMANDQPLLDFTVDVTDASIRTYDVIKKFQDRFKANLKNKYVDRVGKNNTPMLNLQKVTEDFADAQKNLDVSKSYDFAKALGIELDNLAVIKATLTKDNKTIEKFGLPYIYNMIKRLSEKELSDTTKAAAKAEILKFREDPIGGLMTGVKAGIISNSSENQKQQIKELANLQARYGSDVSNFSVLNAERNLVFEHIDNNSITKQVFALNKAKKLSDLWTTNELQYMSHMDPKINVYTKRLRIINSLFDLKSSTQARRKNTSLNLFMDSGTQTAIQNQEDGTNTTSLDVNSKFIQEMHTMLKDGVQEFMRHASKSSSFGAKLEGGVVGMPGKEGNDNHLWVDIDMFKNNTAAEYALKSHLFPYMEAEAERIYKFKQNKDLFKNYAGYNRELSNGKLAGEVFTAFDDVLSNDIKEKIYAAIDKAITEKTNFDLKAFINNSGLQGTVRQNVKEYFKRQSNDVVKILEEAKYISPDLYERFADTNLSKEDQEKILVDAYVYNSWIHNFETGILFYGDFAQFNHDKEEMHKRNTGSTSGGPGYRTDIAAQKFVNDYLAKTSYAKSIGSKAISYDGTFNTAILQDVKRRSIYMDQIKAGLKEEYEKRYAGKNIPQAEIDRRLKIELSKYEEMEEGDGQGFITIDAYRTLANLQNNWSNPQEILFQRILNNEVITVKEVTEMFPVLKAQNFGPLANTELPITAMHKFALAPLIPSVIKGSDWESLHKQMIEKNIQYVTFQTGSKVGSVTSNGKADKIYDDEGKTSLKKDIQFTPNTIYLEYLKNVTNVPNKYKGKTVFSTQLRKLILSNLYDNGKIVNADNEKVAKAYEDTVDAYSEILKFELLNEIGYEYNPETKNYTGNLHDFLDVVQAELDRRDIPEHLVQLVGLNRDNSLKTDLSLHLKADEIEKILVSLVEKRLIKQKVKGEALVQVASSMSNGLWDSQIRLKAATDEQKQKYLGTNNLPFYNRDSSTSKTNAMKVAIALQGDFNYLLKREDVAVYNEQLIDGETKKVLDTKASLAKLNQLIKDDAWMEKNRKLVTLSAVRIPVQGLNSMEFMEVYEFLDPSANNIIIPPTEIVAKSGADFDVDKLTTFMPSISEKGRFIETGMTNEALKAKVEELNKTEEGKKIAERMIKTQKAALENRLITSISDILSLPDNYASLVKPNDTYLLKDDIADKIQDDVIEYNRFENVHDKTKLGKKGQKVISPTRILEVAYNLHKHDVNMIGKKVLGMIAVENSLHPVFNSIGAYLPNTYKAAVFNQGKNKYEDIDQDYDTRLFLPHNETDNGEISLSGINTADGKDNIAELYSQMMNGAVDVEKDAWIFFIQGNYEVTPMITFLLKAGVPKEDAILFVSNPFVREYAKQQRLIKSAYAKLTNTVPQDFMSTMGKYKAAEKAMRKFGIKEKANKLISNDSYYSAVDRKVLAKGLLNENGHFDLTTMKQILKDPKLEDDFLKDYAFGMFLHFIELEKMSKGFTTLKMQSNPDTKTSKTLQEIIRRNVSLEEVKEISKLPKGMVDAVQNSILGSFFNNKLVGDLITPIFSLRNSELVTNFIVNKLQTQSTEISNKFGRGQDGVRQFITKFKNAIPNYIYQNYMSNMIDESGEITSMPKEYDKLMVKEKSGLSRGAEIVGNFVYIDRVQLEKEFANNLYARDNNTEEGYKSKGLVGFNLSDNIFPNESQYVKYVIERERQRSMYPLAEQAENKDYKKFLNLTEKYEKDPAKAKEIAYERFLNQRALINAFNRKAIMDLSNGTYTDMVLDMIDEFKHLKVKYPILAQLSKPNLKSGQSVLTLNDLKDLKDSQLAEIYYQNIKDLGDETVHKVTDASDNARISKLFRLLPVMMIYQHGLGYSKYGFNDALPYEDYIGVMQTAADTFMNNDMTDSTLQTIYNKLLNAKGLFPDYVSSPSLYKSGSPAQPNEILSAPADEQRILELLSRSAVVEETPTQSTEASEYINYSGGAIGSDTIWSEIGKEFGIGKQVDYKPQTLQKLTPEQAKEVEDAYQKAASDLGRKPLAYDWNNPNAKNAEGKSIYYSGGLVRRDYLQAKAADAVFAVGKILEEGDTNSKGYEVKALQVDGGTGYAVQMAINLGKPVYVFDLNYNIWMKYNPEGLVDSDIPGQKGRFDQTDTPVLTKKFAGVGTREITEAGKQAIRDAYTNTFNRPAAPEMKRETIIKPGVSEVFESNPELASIGTAEQYSAYLDSIFPDSKVKDIVYHGTERSFEQFSKDAEKATIADQGIFFAPTWNQARNSGKNIIKAVINSIPLISDNRIERISEKKKQELLDQGYTGYIYSYNKSISSADDIVVFNPEQIHILGNKQDIEGFKQFVKNQPEMKKDTPIQPEVSDMIQPEGLPGIPRTSSSCK